MSISVRSLLFYENEVTIVVQMLIKDQNLIFEVEMIYLGSE